MLSDSVGICLGVLMTASATFRNAVRWHPPLMLFAVLMAITALVSAGGILLDDRILVGSPIWLKPFKFSVSIVLYAITWAWMLSLQDRPRRWMRKSATAVSVLLAIEMVVIIGQVARGRTSHFNAATGFDSVLFGIMGVSIAAVWVLNLVQAVVLLRDRLGQRPIAWAIRLALPISLAGMAVAFLMTGPTADQLQALQHDVPVGAIGAHSVGVPDGGPGMAITGWSTTGGDLRVPHFVGIHALQALPLFALGLGLASRWLPTLRDERTRARLVVVASVAYGGLLALTTWQALRGQPLTEPDAWTYGALAMIAVVTAAGVRFSLVRSNITEARQPRVPA